MNVCITQLCVITGIHNSVSYNVIILMCIKYLGLPIVFVIFYGLGKITKCDNKIPIKC